MHRINILLLTIVLGITAFCNGIKKGNVNSNSIEILYIKGSINTRTPIECGTITKAKSSYRKGDTLIVDKQKYIEIVNQIKTLKELKADSTLPNCDVRIQCRINYANGDSVKLCIGKFNCLIKDGNIMSKNDILVYLIRKYSGYYNYFSKSELLYFPELNKFGIPVDYRDLSIKYNPNNMPTPPPPPH
ncbi:MAG: hypothetical protein NTZ69_10115 [Bacteroidia bacterium]|nr:hypothetical protein [Bacteroidia bacterium]